VTVLTLLAPLAGWAGPLEEVPDPVFAGRMVGDGLAIDPVGHALFAPCPGVVLKVHEARHAVTLRADNGADVLVHIGLETVALKGVGFEVHVADGERVAPGDRLVSFDLDRLAVAAPSLLSPVLVTNPEAFDLRVLAVGREVAVGEPLLELTPRAAAAEPSAAEGPQVVRRLRVTHAHGLHARPAAMIAAEAKAREAAISVAAHGRDASARSPVALMGLGVRAGDEIEIRATGPDAEAAADALEAVVAAINAVPAADIPPPPAAPVHGDLPANLVRGVRAAPGLAVGSAWRLAIAEAPLNETAAGQAHEIAALVAARAAAGAELDRRLRTRTGESRAIVEAHRALLDDPELLDAARHAIAAGASAGRAWREALGGHVASLQASGDERLAERALDLKDLEQQVLWALCGRKPDAPTPPPRAILIADDLLPSDLVALEHAGLGGLCTSGGGPTSHVAVLAAAMDIPALVAAGPALARVTDGATVILDADAGTLDLAPDAARLDAARANLAPRAKASARALAEAAEPCRTADGVRIEVFANVGSVADAEAAARNGAEGCGLLRTEFLFLDRETAPSEDEQLQAYQGVATALAGKPVIVRTLDVGGDKPAPYLALPMEENPALGLRGVRVSLSRPDLLRAQLRAILRVAPAGQCRIMVPMVASVAELQAVRAQLDAVAREAGRKPPPLGVMIETPAAAATADLIAEHADFLSVGTNDLAQYALAMDRGNPALAAEVDALHPAVLRLIRMTAEGAKRRKRPVSVCGGLASNAAAAPILIGLGVTELSVTPARIPAIKAVIRGLDLAACKDLAARACDQTSAEAVRGLEFTRKPRARRPVRKGAPA